MKQILIVLFIITAAMTPVMGVEVLTADLGIQQGSETMLSYGILTPVTLLVMGLFGAMFSTVPMLFLYVIALRGQKEISRMFDYLPLLKGKKYKSI